MRRNLIQREFEPSAMPPYDYRVSPTPYPEARPVEHHEIKEFLDPFPPHAGNQWVSDWDVLRAGQRPESPTNTDVSDDSGSRGLTTLRLLVLGLQCVIHPQPTARVKPSSRGFGSLVRRPPGTTCLCRRSTLR